MKKLIFILLFFFIGENGFCAQSKIYAQLVSTSGALIGSNIQITSTATGPQYKPHVASYLDRFLVVWQEWNGTDLDVKAARVGIDGTIIDSTPITIASGSRTQAMPDVAADGTGWMVVWHAFPTTAVFPSLYAARVNYDGTMGTPLKFGDSRGFGCIPRISWNATQNKFLVLYNSYEDSANIMNVIRWSMLSTTPTATGYTNYMQTNPLGETYYSPAPMPGAGWTFVLSAGPPYEWGGAPGANAINIDTDGTLNDNGYIQNGYEPAQGGSYLLDNNEWSYAGTAAAYDGNYVIGLWTRYHVDANDNVYDGDLYAARINYYDPVEAIGGTAISATLGASECWPSLAGNGSGTMLAVYDKDTSGSTVIASRLLTIDGTGIWPSSEVVLRSDATGGRRSHSAVAYGDNGTGTRAFLAVWTDGWWGAQ